MLLFIGMENKLEKLLRYGKGLDPKETFVIAEIGKNFIQTEEEKPLSEYLENAKRLIDEAVIAGADAVKFQTHEVEDEQSNIQVTSPHFKQMERYRWVERNTRSTPLAFWKKIKEYAVSKGILFFSTPMSRKAAVKLDQVGVPMWKVGSGDADDFLLLDYITDQGKLVVISSGMVSYEELDKIMDYLSVKNNPVGLLYCISKYPCPQDLFNLSTLEKFSSRYPKAIIGFSDHSVDDHDVALAAIKLGARIIEKHFSFSRDLWGPDHKASLKPSEFKELVRAIREGRFETVDYAKYYGDPDRELEGSQNMFRPFFRKTLVVKEDLSKGATIGIDDIVALRPRAHLDGLSPENISLILGKKAKKSIKKHTPISLDLFE